MSIKLTPSKNETTAEILLSLPPKTVGVAGLVVIFAADDGRVYSQMRLGGMKQLSRLDCLALFAEAVTEAYKEIEGEGGDEEKRPDQAPDPTEAGKASQPAAKD